MAQSGFRLYGDCRSGNCYKVALLFGFLGHAYEWTETDVLRSETRTEQFLSMNPNGRVPLLQLPNGKYLAESNAMLLHLADGSPFLPENDYARALCYQWLFFEQYSHEPYIAVARFLLHFEHGIAIDEQRMEQLHTRGVEALEVMERVLSIQDYFAGDSYSIADIALFAYTHVAGDGGFDLSPYGAVAAWMGRVREQAGHFDMAALRP
ncbi:MAG: glutathione S-transferase family protein [Xanthomonadales bacterium]|nr:glutathione S-transferase family protein [Gammaproteobacteria bacterium]NNE05923.1 glutathione S-transferase family protein [Xanthomonadales bacterium]NNL94679.1 glutathione S-transferase family protein [Xanthomonadales bacterium]